MLGPNLITSAAVPHLQTILQSSLPGPMHEELRQTLDAATRPLGGTLSLEGQGEISGIFNFWTAESTQPRIYHPSDEPFHDGFQSGWLKSAREYCLQGGQPHHVAILQSLQDLDKRIDDLARVRDQSLPQSELRMRFEQQRSVEARDVFLRKRRHARLTTMEGLHTPHLFDLMAPASPASKETSGLASFIHSLFGWEYGVRFFHAVGEPMEGLASLKTWEKLLSAHNHKNRLRMIGNLETPGHILGRQNLPDSEWLPMPEDPTRIINIGRLRAKGFFKVASFNVADQLKITRLGRPLIQQALVIDGIIHYIHQTIDDGTHLTITIKSTKPDHSLQKSLPSTFAFRVLKPPQSLPQSNFWEAIGKFLNMKEALKDTTWGNETYDISAYLDVLTLGSPVHQELWATLNGRKFKFMDREWRIQLTNKGQFTNSSNQPLFEYAVSQAPQPGEEKTPEFLIRMTPLTLDQLETVEEIIRTMLPELLQAPVPSSNFSFGGQGQVWRVG